MEHNRLRIALCAQDRRELDALYRYMAQQDTDLCCVVFRSGGKLLQELEQGVLYDAIVLDECMADMDALEFVMQLDGLPVLPVRVLLASPDYMRRFQRLAADRVEGCLCKPIHGTVLARRIRSFCRMLKRGADLQPAVPLTDWGIQVDATRSTYLLQALQVVMQSDEQMALRKEILPEVAARFDVSPAAVDSGLRRLIEELEQKGTPAYSIFKQQYGLDERKPAVKQFLYACKSCALNKKEAERYAG